MTNSEERRRITPTVAASAAKVAALAIVLATTLAAAEPAFAQRRGMGGGRVNPQGPTSDSGGIFDNPGFRFAGVIYFASGTAFVYACVAATPILYSYEYYRRTRTGQPLNADSPFAVLGWIFERWTGLWPIVPILAVVFLPLILFLMLAEVGSLMASALLTSIFRPGYAIYVVTPITLVVAAWVGYLLFQSFAYEFQQLAVELGFFEDGKPPRRLSYVRSTNDSVEPSTDGPPPLQRDRANAPERGCTDGTNRRRRDSGLAPNDGSKAFAVFRPRHMARDL